MSRAGRTAEKLIAVITAIFRPSHSPGDPLIPGPAPGERARQNARIRVQGYALVACALGVVILILLIVKLA